MSEVGEKLPIEKGKIPQKEQGIKSTETPKVPEKISPLKKASRAMRYVLDSTLDMLPFPTKSAAANEYLLEIAKDEKPKPTTYKESVEAREKKDVIVEAYGDEGPLEVLKGRESKVGRKVAVLVLGGGNVGIYNAASLMEMQKQGLLDNADGMFAISSGAGNILAAGLGRAEDFVGIYSEENCAKVKVIDKETKNEKEEGRFVKIPGADDPKGQINALKDAYVNGSDKPIISTSSVEEALRSRAEALIDDKGMKLDVKAELKNNWKYPDGKAKDLKVLVMDKNTTVSKFLDLNEVDDPFEAVGAAIDVLGVSDKGWTTVNMNGQKMEGVDAAFGRDPIPLDKIFDLGYTDIVVLANGPAGESGQLRAIQVFLAEIAKNENGYGYNEDIIQLIRGHKRGSKIAADRLEEQIKKKDTNKRVVVIGSAKDGLRVEELCTDSEKIKKVYEEVRRLSGKRIFNRDVKLGSDKPADLRNAGEELKAMDASGKSAETKPEGVVVSGVESSGNASTGAKRVEEVKDKTPAEEREAESKSLKNKASSVVERVLGSGKEITYYEWELVKAEVKRRVEADEGLADVIKDMKIEIDGKKPGNLSSNKRFLKAEACIKLGVPMEDALDEFTAGGRRVQLGRREKEMWSKDHEYTDKMKEGAKNGRSRIEVFEELKLNDIDNMKIVDFLDLWKVRKSANPVELVKMIEQKGSRDFVLEHLKMNEKQGLEKTITEIGSLAQKQYLDVYAMFSASVEGGRAHFDKIKDGDSLRYKMREAAGVAWDKLKDFWKGGGGGGTDLDPTWPTNF